jgi:hypothetical protein
VFARCAMLIGASARTRTGDDGGMVFTTTDQGEHGRPCTRLPRSGQCGEPQGRHGAPLALVRAAGDG